LAQADIAIAYDIQAGISANRHVFVAIHSIAGAITQRHIELTLDVLTTGLTDGNIVRTITRQMIASGLACAITDRDIVFCISLST
ncbi:hypothetical protein, partial [Glaesserella parasuis]|uniref:hypothetical protein n=1 Tax=Glaesserella parasuis TaxID=738 RepID=UPI003F2C1AEB